MANSNNNIVRPLGRFGHAYQLDDRSYRLYRIIIVLAFIAVAAIIIFDLLTPWIFKGSPWPSALLLTAACLVFGATTIVCLRIADAGLKIDPDVAATLEAKRSRPISTWIRVNLVLSAIFGILFIGPFATAILTALFRQQHVPMHLILLLIGFIGFFILVQLQWRTRK